jgi:LmbE family N-acetylglucosaminyl deacetylase
MFNSKFKYSLASKFLKKFKKKSEAYNSNDLSNSAIVVAPHFDDETLGCGGIIALKKTAGASIKVVFMTDGTQSHSKLMENDKLNSKRMEEAYNACRVLGLERDDVIVLNFCDSKLENSIDDAEMKLQEIVNDVKPDELFLPSRKEPWIYSGDHLASVKITMNVLKKYNQQINIYEYPVWYWYAFPWVSFPFKLKKSSLSIFKNSLNGFWGAGLSHHFNCYFELDGTKEIKMKALDQHESQMKNQSNDEPWNTLTGISQGEFLKCFFGEFEVFNKHTINIS